MPDQYALRASSQVAIFFVSRKVKWRPLNPQQSASIRRLWSLILRFVAQRISLFHLCVDFDDFFGIAISVEWIWWTPRKLWSFGILMAVPSRKWRPRLSGCARYIMVRSSVFELWHERKITLGFSEATNCLCWVSTASNRPQSIKFRTLLEFDGLFISYSFVTMLMYHSFVHFNSPCERDGRQGTFGVTENFSQTSSISTASSSSFSLSATIEPSFA